MNKSNNNQEYAISVANYFISKSLDNKRPMSLMDLQKFVYLAHGWNLAINKQPLIDEDIYAWEHGIKIKSIYAQAKIHGSSPVKEYLSHLIKFTDDKSETHMGTSPTVTDDTTRKLLDEIWKSYHKLNAIELTRLVYSNETSPRNVTYVNQNINPFKEVVGAGKDKGPKELRDRTLEPYLEELPEIVIDNDLIQRTFIEDYKKGLVKQQNTK